MSFLVPNSMQAAVKETGNRCLRGPLLQSHVMDMFDEESGGRTDIPGWFLEETIRAKNTLFLFFRTSRI